MPISESAPSKVRFVRLLPPAPGPTLSTLFLDCATEIFAPGRIISCEADAACGVFAVRAGTVSLSRSLPNGRRAVLGFVGAGQYVGLAAQGAYGCTVEAVDQVRLRRLSRHRLLDRIDDAPILGQMLLAAISQEISRAQEQILLLGRMTAEERVASFLLTMSDGLDGYEVTLPMSRRDLADHLGLTIETVCPVLTRLQRGGLIVFRSRHHLTILRLRALREMSGGNEWTDVLTVASRQH